MGYGEEVNTSDFDSDIHGFDSHYPCAGVISRHPIGHFSYAPPKYPLAESC